MFFGEPFGGLIPGAPGSVLAALLRTDAPLTGRQIHGLLSDDQSLWSVQEASKVLDQLGLVRSQAVGRARAHSINEEHIAIAALRSLIDAIAALSAVVEQPSAPTPAAGNAIHAGISARDAIVTARTGSVTKKTDHATEASE